MEHKLIQPLKQLSQDTLALAQKQGATSAAVNISTNHGYHVQVRGQGIDRVEYHQDQMVLITAYRNHQKGTAIISDLNWPAIQKAVTRACDIARVTTENPYTGLADKHLMATALPDLDLYHPWSLTVEEAIDKALSCAQQAYACDPRITNIEEVSIDNSENHFVYANTHGFMGTTSETLHHMHCAVIAQEKEAMERGHDYTLARDPQDLEDFKEITSKTVHQALAKLNPQKLPTGQWPVLFKASRARELLALFVNAIQGKALYREASFLAQALNSPVFADHVMIYERPYLPKELGSAAFDSDGVATRNQHFVEQGILNRYALGAYAARKLGLSSTGNAGGVHNLRIEGHTESFPSLLKTMHKGIFVTELLGCGVNLLTGDYSQGAFGFWVEEGRIQYPLSEITIAGNLKEMFRNLIALGDDIDRRGNIHTGSILMSPMMIAGSST